MKNAKHRKFAVALELAVINTNGHKLQRMHALEGTRHDSEILHR